MINLKVIGSLGVVILLLASFSYGLYKDIDSLETKLTFKTAENASLRASNESSLKAIVSLNQRIITAQRASQELTETNKKLSLEFNDTKAKLESHINRLDKAFEKKPTLMLKITNKSFDKFIDKVSCNSGDLASCKD